MSQHKKEPMTDFNDMARLCGLDAVRDLIEDVIRNTPDIGEPTDAPPAEASEGEEPPDEGKKSQSSQLVKFVQEQAELFHDENRDTYATVKATQETYRLLGSKFKSWLMAAFSTATGKTGRDQSVREALCTLDGLALHYSEQKTVHVRVALHDGAYFVDLGQLGNSLAVKIEAGQWQVVATHEVRFIRPDSMRPLPTPMQGGDIHQLWHFVNVPEDARLLVLTWLCECLRPDTEFPVLELVGEAGTAKSTTQKYLRMLIDPNASNLRSPPKSVEDVFVGAGCSWITSYENVSHLTPALQDALCTLATGGGYATRKHYTNNEESVINVMRPTVLNGISASVTAHDLIDRSISVEPQLIKLRRQGAEIGREFDAIYPQLVGSLFYLMAQTLECLPRAELPKEDRPRMTSFAYLGIAVQMALGYPEGEFMRQFHLSRMESVSRTIDGSPVAAALLEWFEARGKRAVQMSIKELLAEVETHKPQFTDAWPRSPKGFGDALRRAAPSLRYMGVEVLSLGKIGHTVRWAVRNLESGGYLMKPSRECRASRDDVEKIDKKQDLNGHEHDLHDLHDIETNNIPRTSDFPSQEAKGLPLPWAINEKVDFPDGEEF